jgi:hypothetical protein
VVGRTNTTDRSEFWVDVVLEHAGHRYYARCNSYQAGLVKDTVYRCGGLHADHIVNCQWYRDRERSKGYDLIWGNKRNQNGELDNFGENELLDITRQEK